MLFSLGRLRTVIRIRRRSCSLKVVGLGSGAQTDAYVVFPHAHMSMKLSREIFS